MVGISKPARKRNRISLVCSNCREKKIKCDRQKPCFSCIKSSTINSCTYVCDITNNKIDLTLNDRERHTSILSLDNNYIKEKKHNNIKPSSSESILSVEFNPYIEYFILRKPSNTQRRPVFFSFYATQKHFLSYKFLLSFKQVLNNERKLWKSKNFDKKFQIIDLHYNPNSDCNDTDNIEINSLIESLICKNYYAVLERLKYFQTQLNNLLLNSYLPMGVIQLIFHHYFSVKPDGILFNKPKKYFEYSFIALIASIVELTNIFSKYENNFNFPLSQNNNEFNEIAVKLLNLSNFRRKSSIFSVYTLLNLRLSLMIYGDAQSSGINAQNAYPLFQNAVSMCIEMGIHHDQDNVIILENINDKRECDDISFAKEIPVKSIKLLWNHLLILDALYFIDTSTPPFIDDRFCHGFYDMPDNSNLSLFIRIIKEVTLTTLSNAPTTLNSIFEDINKINKLLASLNIADEFGSIENLENNIGSWRLFYIKFKLLHLLFLYQVKIEALLDNQNLTKNYSKEVLENKRNKDIIESLRKEGLIKCKLVYLIGLNTILKISQSKLDYKFLVFSREIFSSWIGIKTNAFVDMIVSKNINEKKNINVRLRQDQYGRFKLIDAPILDTENLESALFDTNTSKHVQTINQVENICNPESIVSFLTNVYENMLNIPALFSDYKFFCTTKLFLFTIYFLYCYINVHCDSNFVILDNFEKLKSLTQNIVSKHLQNGRLSHLLPADFIMNSLQNSEDKQRDNDNLNLNNELVNENNSQNDDENNVNITDHWDTDQILPSQFDDIASSVFEDEKMVSIFNEINEFFNQSNE